MFSGESGDRRAETRGMIRRSQFYSGSGENSDSGKSYESLESLLADAEKVLQLPCCNIAFPSLATADLGFGSL